MNNKELPLMQVEVVYAGGTISSLATAEGCREGGHKVDLLKLLEERLPGSTSGLEISGAEFAYLGLSENIDQQYWLTIRDKVELALLKQPQAVIITHGTDSMEQTARYLDDEFRDQLRQQRSILILTGANRDIASPNTDAWDNLNLAIRAAKDRLDPGVYVAFHGKIIEAKKVVKEPFDGDQMNYISVDDPEYDLRRQRQRESGAKTLKDLSRALPMVRRLEDEVIIDYPVNKIVDDHQKLESQVTKKTRYVLLTLYHSGTANTEKPELSVAVLIEKLRRDRGIMFFGVTENGEPVDLHSYETSVKLRRAGLVPLYDIPKAVALEKLRILAGQGNEGIMEKMLTNYAGEIKSQILIDDVQELQKLYGQSE